MLEFEEFERTSSCVCNKWPFQIVYYACKICGSRSYDLYILTLFLCEWWSFSGMVLPLVSAHTTTPAGLNIPPYMTAHVVNHSPTTPLHMLRAHHLGQFVSVRGIVVRLGPVSVFFWQYSASFTLSRKCLRIFFANLAFLFHRCSQCDIQHRGSALVSKANFRSSRCIGVTNFALTWFISVSDSQDHLFKTNLTKASG